MKWGGNFWLLTRDKHGLRSGDFSDSELVLGAGLLSSWFPGLRKEDEIASEQVCVLAIGVTFLMV